MVVGVGRRGSVQLAAQGVVRRVPLWRCRVISGNQGGAIVLWSRVKLSQRSLSMNVTWASLRTVTAWSIVGVFFHLAVGLAHERETLESTSGRVHFWLTLLHNNDGESQLINAGGGLEDSAEWHSSPRWSGNSSRRPQRIPGMARGGAPAPTGGSSWSRPGITLVLANEGRSSVRSRRGSFPSPSSDHRLVSVDVQLSPR